MYIYACMALLSCGNSSFALEVLWARGIGSSAFAICFVGLWVKPGGLFVTSLTFYWQCHPILS